MNAWHTSEGLVGTRAVAIGWQGSIKLPTASELNGSRRLLLPQGRTQHIDVYIIRAGKGVCRFHGMD